MRMARLELARQSHTPLKRARIPIPPHPRLAIVAQPVKILQVENIFSLVSNSKIITTNCRQK
jgi:hypothetical protein